jgi:hypothetical protein
VELSTVYTRTPSITASLSSLPRSYTLQQQLDLYHAMVVMQIILSLNFFYLYSKFFVHLNTILKPLMGYDGAGIRKFIRDSSRASSRDCAESRTKFLCRKVIIAIQTFTTLMFTVWLVYVWIKGSQFGSQPECNHFVKYVFFFATFRATENWLWVLFTIYLVFSCTLLLRFIWIVFVHVDSYHKPLDVVPLEGQANDSDKTVYTSLKVVLSVGCVSSTKSSCY